MDNFWKYTSQFYAANIKGTRGDGVASGTWNDPFTSLGAGVSAATRSSLSVYGFFNERVIANSTYNQISIYGNNITVFDGTQLSPSLFYHINRTSKPVYLYELEVKNFDTLFYFDATDIGSGARLEFHVSKCKLFGGKYLNFLFDGININNTLLHNVTDIPLRNAKTNRINGIAFNTFIGCDNILIYDNHSDVVLIHNVFTHDINNTPSQLYFIEDTNKFKYNVIDSTCEFKFNTISTYGDWNTTFRNLTDLRTFVTTNVYFTPNVDDLEFLKECIAYSFTGSIATASTYLQNCRMPGSGAYTAYSDVGFVDLANKDFHIKTVQGGYAENSICFNIGFNRENAGAFGPAMKYAFDNTDFPTGDRTNIADTVIANNALDESIAKSTIKTFNQVNRITKFNTLTEQGLRNNELLRTVQNIGQELTNADPLNEEERYIVETLQITYDSVVYNAGDIFDTVIGTTTFTGSGTVRQFLELLPMPLIEAKGTKQVFADDGTRDAYFDSTLDWCNFYLYKNNPQGNFDGNGDLIAGEADTLSLQETNTDIVTGDDRITQLYISGNAADVELLHVQLRIRTQNNEYFYID